MVSLLCPTRNRTTSLDRMLESLHWHTTDPDAVELVCYLDDDDQTSARFIARVQDRGWPRITIRTVVGPAGGVNMSDMWNRAAAAARGEILGFIDDEALFCTRAWAQMIRDEFAKWPDRAVLVHPDDRIHGDVLAAYFFVHRTWLNLFGQITPPHFSYGYADVWCSEVAQAAGRKVYLPTVVVENMAPKDQPPDAVHQANAQRDQRDRNGDRYNATQAEREQHVKLLRAYIDQWSPR